MATGFIMAIAVAGMATVYSDPYPTREACNKAREAIIARGDKATMCFDATNFRAKHRTDTPAIKAFKEGWMQEMEKTEPEQPMEQDI